MVILNSIQDPVACGTDLFSHIQKTAVPGRIRINEYQPILNHVQDEHMCPGFINEVFPSPSGRR
jgi:hypothetical protein